MSESTSVKIIRNAIYNYAGFLMLVAVQFFLTPYIVRSLGKDAYGVYALISVFIGYISLLELGIGVSITKFISEYYVEKRYDRINGLVSTAFILYLSLGAIGALIIIVFREYFATSLFKVPDYLTADTIFAFTVAGFAFFFTFVFGVYISILIGLQRMDLTNKISTVLGILNVVGIVMLLRFGYGLKEVVILSSANGVIGVLVSAYISKRIMPELNFIPKFFDKNYITSILKFSMYVFATKVAILVYQNFGKLIIGIFLPVKYVTIYAIGTMLSGFIYRFSGLIASPVMPASSELLAKKDTNAIRELFLRGTKYLTLLNISSVCFLGIFADNIMQIWMGEGFEESVIVFRILLLGVLLETLQHIGGNMLTGLGKPNISAYYSIGNTILTIVLSYLLLKNFGLIGVPLGVTLAQFIFIIFFIPHLCNIFEVRLISFLSRAIIKPILVCIPPTLSVLVLKIMLPQYGLATLVVSGGIFVLIYSVLILVFILDERDLQKVTSIISIAKYIEKIKRIKKLS